MVRALSTSLTNGGATHDQTIPTPQLQLLLHHYTSLSLSPRSPGSFEYTRSSIHPTHHNPATMSSGEILKADKDFSKETDAAIPEAEKLGAVCSDAL
jgi:hypothetical protein